MKREEVLRHPAYWFEDVQNELYSQVVDYMEREQINRTELANRLKVSKGYVSQILNGNYNYTLKKWIELCLAIGIVPGEYRKLEDVIQSDKDFAIAKKNANSEKKASISLNFGSFKLPASNDVVFQTGTTTVGGGHAATTVEKTSSTMKNSNRANSFKDTPIAA